MPSNPTFTIGGTISGSTGTLVLQNNGTNDLTRTVNGTFAFPGSVSSGSGYNVTLSSLPSGQSCTVSNGTGVATSNVANILVACSSGPTFTLTTAVVGSGSVSRNPDQASYPAGTQVQLTAVPAPGQTFGSWSGALTGSQNPAAVTVNTNLSVTAHFASAPVMLTVVKAGLGAGSVTGPGINCGTDCTESYGSGAVALTATPAAGSTFGSWAGCDSVAAIVCTVNATSSRTVTALFNPSSDVAAPEVSVAPTSNDGSYVVTVRCTTSPCGSSFFLQEAPTTAFNSPAETIHINATFPRSIPFSGKGAGTYCYRAAFSRPNWGNVACVQVTLPTTAVLRIANTSSYDLVDARLNNVQRINYPYIIPPGGSFDFVFTAAGTVNYQSRERLLRLERVPRYLVHLGGVGIGDTRTGENRDLQ